MFELEREIFVCNFLFVISTNMATISFISSSNMALVPFNMAFILVTTIQHIYHGGYVILSIYLNEIYSHCYKIKKRPSFTFAILSSVTMDTGTLVTITELCTCPTIHAWVGVTAIFD